MNSTDKSPYLELLKKVLIDYENIGTMEMHPLGIVNRNWKNFFLFPIDKLLRKYNYSINKLRPVLKEERMNGSDWPAQARTMIGYNRLQNIEDCIRIIRNENIEGDLLEAGVWRGGAAMFMKAVLNELGIHDKKVWLADSFMGLPEPKKEYSEDQQSNLHKQKILSVSKDEVMKNFEDFDLLDDKVKFIEGWFDETLAKATVEKLSLLRLDADLYESTSLALNHLYPKLAIGGFVIIDDFNAFPFCKKAVMDYWIKYGIKEEIIEIDKEAVYWRKEK